MENKNNRQGEGGGQPLKWNSPEELEEKINEYYRWAKENEKHITVTGLAWFLGCDRQTLLNYEGAEENQWLKRVDDETRRKYVGTVKNAKRFIEMNYEEGLFNKSSTTGAIFTLKNNYNWVDKQEVVTNNNVNNLDLSVEEIEKQLKELDNTN
ncbi:terminase small subunit [Clostridium sp. DJ247]|uniref:terminase small subunit n=1 Tax=Clostridium sp. DJ247 TaxID=2726188 RepID=UPI001624ABBE|nr:terminase small subunit [Clostridium sp. DJ247]MBC2579981.1 hypothetical protein [Clostridium sp. DJ247]